MGAFQVLEEMTHQDPSGEYLRVFMSPDNFIEAKSGSDGWGWIKMAVNNDTIIRMAQGQIFKLALFVYDIDKYREVQRSMESEAQE